MALDIYVMPLWRFKVGDFRSPIERATGLRPRVVGPEVLADRPSTVGWLGRWEARRQVGSIRRAVEAANRVRVRWPDQGEVVYSEQSRGMESLRAFALWLDHRDRLPRFEWPPDGDYYRHPAWSLEDRRPPSCPQLVGHDCHSGYFLPCEFDRLAEVEPHLILGRWPASRSVGSSPRLIRELASIEEHLRPLEGVGDPITRVRSAFRQLREAAGLSCRHRLPLIFWG